MPVKINISGLDAGLLWKSLLVLIVASASIFMGPQVNSSAYAKLSPHPPYDFVSAEIQVLTNRTTGETVCYALLSEDSRAFPKNTSLFIKGPLDHGVVSFVHLPRKLNHLNTKFLHSNCLFQTRCSFSSPPIRKSEISKITSEQYLFEQSQPHSWTTKSGASIFHWVSGPCQIQISSIRH